MSLVTIARTASYRTVGTPQADGLRINGVSIDTEPNGGTAVDIDDPAVRRDLNATVGRWVVLGSPLDVDVPSALTSTLTVGTETGDAIDVTLQINNANGSPISSARGLTAWISDDASGAGLTASAPTSLTNTGGSMRQVVSKKYLSLTTGDTGAITLTLGDAGSSTWYVAVQLPSGHIIVSSAITFV